MDYGHGTRLADNGSIVCMAHPGGLHRVAVNVRGQAGNLLTLYDAAKITPTPPGPVLAVIDLVNAPIGDIAYGFQVQTGVVATVSIGVPGDVTVVTD